MNGTIVIRIVISYFVLWGGLRLLGKKEMAKLTYLNVATSAAMGSLTAQAATNESHKIYISLLALIMFFLLTFSLEYFSLKFIGARKVFEGRPTIVIAKGKIINENLKKMRLSVDNILSKLRENKVFNIEDIDYAILETDGQLSILLKSDKKPLTSESLKGKTKVKGLSINLIKDGTIIEENLKRLGLSEKWLMEQLNMRKIEEKSQVLLAQIDQASGELYIDLKN